MAREADELAQLVVTLRGIRILNQEGRGELAGTRNQLVVSIEFVLNRFASGHPLAANHLMDLVPDGLSVFEKQGEMIADGQAAAILFGDEEGAQDIANAFVIAERKSLLEMQRLQLSIPSPG